MGFLLGLLLIAGAVWALLSGTGMILGAGAAVVKEIGRKDETPEEATARLLALQDRIRRR